MVSSCGIRDDSSAFTNQLSGNWSLNKFECYLNGNLKESFTLDLNQQSFKLEFVGRSIEYNMSGTCNESTRASYVFSYSSMNSGFLSFVDLEVANSCDLLVVEDSSGEAINVNFQLDSSGVTDLNWQVDENTLTLLNFNSFKGTTDTCDGICNCFGIWQKS